MVDGLGFKVYGSRVVDIQNLSLRTPKSYTVASTAFSEIQAFEFSCNTGASTIRIGFWGPLYYKYNKEPSK